MVLDLEDRLAGLSSAHQDEKKRLEQLLQSSTQECLKSHELQQRMVREYADLEARNQHLAEAVRLLEARDCRKDRSEASQPQNLPELPNPGVLDGVNSSKADLDDIKKELNQMYRDLGLQQLVISE